MLLVVFKVALKHKSSAFLLMLWLLGKKLWPRTNMKMCYFKRTTALLV